MRATNPNSHPSMYDLHVKMFGCSVPPYVHRLFLSFFPSSPFIPPHPNPPCHLPTPFSLSLSLFPLYWWPCLRFRRLMACLMVLTYSSWDYLILSGLVTMEIVISEIKMYPSL